MSRRFKRPVADLKKQILSCIGEYDHPSAVFISEQINCKPYLVRKIINLLRDEDGVSIQPGKGGYIRSDEATNQDDVHLFRKALNSHAHFSKIINAAQKDINTRWKETKYYKDVQQVFGIFAPKGLIVQNTIAELEDRSLKI